MFQTIIWCKISKIWLKKYEIGTNVFKNVSNLLKNVFRIKYWYLKWSEIKIMIQFKMLKIGIRTHLKQRGYRYFSN